MKYVKKPIVIEAVRYDGTNVNEIDDFVGSDLRVSQDHYATDDVTLSIETLEGWMKISVGDYVIKGVQDEFYPCKPDIFEASYDVCKE